MPRGSTFQIPTRFGGWGGVGGVGSPSSWLWKADEGYKSAPEVKQGFPASAVCYQSEFLGWKIAELQLHCSKL